MGRKKVEVEYIQKDKKRSTTYDKRKKGLLKKAYELATLCDVPLCMVIYPGPNSDPVTYPEKREEVGAVIDRYVSGSREENAKRNLNLQQGLALGKKSGDRPGTKRLQSKPVGLPCSKATIGGGGGGWYPALDGLSREELVKLASVLDSKLHQVEERMRGSFGIYNGNANANAITTTTTTSAAAIGLGGGDHVQIAAGFDHGMQWPMSAWQPDDIGSSSYDPNAYVGPNFYYAQVGSSHSLAMPQPQPLTAFYGGTVKFEPHQTPRANPGLKWYEQGKFLL